jgi:Integrase core domain
MGDHASPLRGPRRGVQPLEDHGRLPSWDCGVLPAPRWAPRRHVVDNDSSIVAGSVGRNARLHPEVAALCGHLGLRIIVLEPARPESKGQVERTNGYLETSFLPLRSFTDIEDLQTQSDQWADEVAYRRHHRRVGGRVGEALAAEQRYLHALPDPLPDVDLRTEVRVQRDGFVRVRDVDYSVPPGLAGRRVQVRLAPSEVVVHCEGTEIARTVGASRRQTSCSLRLMSGRCVWRGRPGPGSAPATSIFLRSTSPATTLSPGVGT